ncbi:zinc finger protein 512B isoform X2 [Bufo gargarizans]|uniref:zinc finger protein 512B isoform X2 n=1 Tax=Bufo gargarizans TaxID=30331 RepID=UPI001CF17E1E|nr:zinc finger protein 512B isoform X2 [Bufo gargarizans]
MTDSERRGPAVMADSVTTQPRRQFPRISKSRASTQLQFLASDSGSYYNRRTVQKRYARPENRELRGIPPSLISEWKEMFKTLSRVRCPSSGCWVEFPSVYGLKQHYQRCQGAPLLSRMVLSCPHCEAVFASRPQLQKHLMWNHSEKEESGENRISPHVVSNGAKEKYKGVMKKGTTANKVSKSGTVQTTGERGGLPHVKANGKKADIYLSNEDPERMRHRRKQKTPKKFTGEQPSITTTFGLKGLGKTEDKSRGRQGRILQGRVEEQKKKAESVNLRLEHIMKPPSGSVDDKCQRLNNKKGEVICPNCLSVTRKTMAGLRKHMDVCEQLQEALRCQQCRKQFKSKAGLNYHTMAEHINKSSSPDSNPLNDPRGRERLRKMLKQMGKLRCPKQNCSATFSSLMGYQYHTQRCGTQQCDREKLHFSCPQCNKAYQSKAGRDYHVRSEHCADSEQPGPESNQTEVVEDFERTPSGRVRRHSAQVAVFHLQEIAEDELAREESRRRKKEDLVPDSRRLNYLRPGLPTFNPQLLDRWKALVKENGFICCPNNCCEAIYSSVSGLKAHLANCNKGNHSGGKYRCLLCQKEFSSESGVKYHILKTHSQNWFRVSNVSLPPKRKRSSEISPDMLEIKAIDKNKKKKLEEKGPSPPPTKETPVALIAQPKKTSSKLGTCTGPKGKVRKGGPSRRGK